MCELGGRVGEKHQQNGLPTPLKLWGTVVGESSKTEEPQVEQNPAPPPFETGPFLFSAVLLIALKFPFNPGKSPLFSFDISQF